MPARRSRGEGSVHFNATRNRWIATAQVGFAPDGKRIVKTATGRTKTEAKNKLKELLRNRDEGFTSSKRYTVADAIDSWLTYGLSGRSHNTVKNCTSLANTHIVPDLGARKLQDLTSEDVDRWLAKKAKTLSRATLQRLLSILRRAISRELRRDRVRRNVALLCEVPGGTEGRPSKSLNLLQATALLQASAGSPIHAYIVLSLLTGTRTEELRALTWDHVDLQGRLDEDPPVPPTMEIWRSVREGGDTKTKRSRRTMRLPQLCVDALQLHKSAQDAERATLQGWQDNNLVFCSGLGAALDAANVRRSFRTVAQKAGLDPKEWTPRELRHSFVSLMSAAGVPLEEIARLVGHRSTSVTESVYRKQLRPVMTEGAETMDRIFRDPKNEPADAPET